MRKTLALIIFWSSFQSITLEVLLTRIYSATIGFNYAYVIISIGLGGLGIGALLIVTGTSGASYQTLIAATAISLPLLLFFIALVPATVGNLYIYFGISCVPFVLTGAILSKALGNNTREAHSIYFVDLFAASAAPPISVFMMYYIDPQTILLACAACGGLLAATLVWRLPSRNRPNQTDAAAFRKRTYTICLAALIICSGFVGFNFYSSHTLSDYATPLKPSLNLAIQQGKDNQTVWNPISRVDLLNTGGYGVLGWMVIDGDASTPILAWNQSAPLLPITQYLLHIPYALNQRNNVLIIGAGGGADVDEALESGAQNITAVEVNPTIVSMVKSFGAAAGNIYTNPKVSVDVDEGRSFLGRSTQLYDLISMTLVDSWAAVSTGAYATSEAYLYTTNAFQLMFNHLAPDGTLVIVRWYFELPKDILTLTQSLEQDGVPASQVGNHIAIIQQPSDQVSTTPGNVMIIVNKAPFTSKQLSALNNASANYSQIYPPRADPSSSQSAPSLSNDTAIYSSFFASDENGSILTNAYPSMRVVPSTDNSPYYFDFTVGIPFQLAEALLVNIVIAALIGIIAFARRASRRGIASNGRRWAVYYGLIGLGFIFVEIALLQRLTLLIGYPTIAFASLLFFLLASCGCGSILSSRIKTASLPTRIAEICALIAFANIALVAILPTVVESAVSLGLVERVGVSGVFMVPLGLLMGIPFPSGMRWISNTSNPGAFQMGGVAAVLGINFITSVVASVLAVIVGIYTGLNYSLTIAAGCYAVAGLVWFASRKQISLAR